LHFPHDQLESCVVIFDFWGPKALQKKKKEFLGIGQLVKILSLDNLKTTGAIRKMKLTCELGICTIGNVEFLGLGEPVKILILEV
jgi:hypothetical protein